MASLNFQGQLKRGDLVIRIIFQTNSTNRKFLNTSFKLPGTKVRGVYKFWDADKQRAKQGAEKFEELNEYLQSQESKFHEYLKQCKENKATPRIDEISNLLERQRKTTKALPISASTNSSRHTITTIPAGHYL
jgi:hypothetical protein